MEDPSKWVYESSRASTDRHQNERVSQGFSVYDWYNFNSYLDWIIVGALEKFKTDGTGYPGRDKADTEEKWHAILDKMISGFKAHDRLMNDWDPKTAEQDRAVWEEGKTLFIEFYDSLWD